VQGVKVARWAAWAPGLEDRAAWEEWSRHPRSLYADGAPDVAFLPPLLRRRCGRLSRMMLKVAFGCGSPDELARVSTVFASRHGDTAATVALLECLARGEAVSANRFSHSVHNTQAGLFSIAASNREPASALAAGRNTFGCAFLEATGVLRRAGAGRVLLVIGDEPLPPVLARFADEPQAAYAVALLLETDVQPDAIVLEVGREDGRGGRGEPGISWPNAAEFLRWSLSAEPVLTLAHAASRWTWRRALST
jgi:hypothetical protein